MIAERSAIAADRSARKKNRLLAPRFEFRFAALSGTQPQLFATELAGARQLAEIVLEEGELLALRLPKRAIWMFEESHRLFVRADDTLGENLAAISAAMAACRAGDRGLASDWLARASDEYQVRDPPGGDPSNAWVLRAAACAAWLRERGGEGPLSTWVSRALVQRYGSAIPAELAFAPSVSASEVSPVTIIRKVPLVPVVGAISVVVAVVWLFVLTKSNVEQVGTFLGTALILLVEAIGFWLIWTAFRAHFMRLTYFVTFRQSIAIEINRGGRFALELETTLLPRSVVQLVEASAQSSVIMRAVLPVFRALNRQSRFINLAPPGFGSYFESGLQIPDDLIKRLHRRFWLDYCCLLFIDPAAARYAWEAIIGSRAERGWRRLFGRSPELVRAGDMLPRVPTGFKEWSTASIYVVARSGLATIAAWRNTSVETQVAPTLAAFPGSALRVLHLVGRARRGASGSVFSVGGQGSNLGELVRIDRLPLSETAIVVVQEEPAERLRRLDVDREQTADARDWAAQVFRAGAHTVIFIPAMPLTLAERSIAALARKFNASRPPDVWRLIDAARAVRREVTLYIASRAEQREVGLESAFDATARYRDLRELAMEITLFSRSRDFHVMNSLADFFTTEIIEKGSLR